MSSPSFQDPGPKLAGDLNVRTCVKQIESQIWLSGSIWLPAHACSRRKSGALSLQCTQPSDGQSDSVFGSFFKTLFPSAEERRKEEVRRRRKWMPKPTSHTPEPPKQESSPAVSNYVPPELSESGKVDIGNRIKRFICFMTDPFS